MRFRIMFSVLGGLLGIVVLAFISWFFWERAVLWVGGNRFRDELAELKRITFRQDYLEACQEGGTKRIRQVAGVQLRFISEAEYVIEPVCADKTIQAVPLKQGKLWGGITRLYGPGIFIPIKAGSPEITDGWVQLIKGKTSIAVGFFNGQTEVRWQLPDAVIGGESPAIAGCTDWGFACCQLGNTEGVGVQSFPTDCVTSCFQSCNQRPVILFFNADPMMNNDRVVFLQGVKATVQFGYEVTDFDGSVANTQVDFGDGEMSQPLTAKEESVSHDYVCLRNQCYFEVVLQARDSKGAQIAEGQTDKIMIVMEP